MISVKKIIFVLVIVSILSPLSAFSSRKKVKEDDEASLQRQQELMEKRTKAEADIAARKEKLEREEEEKLEAERLEAEKAALEAEEAEKRRIEEEKLEAERLEKEKQEQAELEEKKQQELLQQQLELELERQKAISEKNKKEYLSDYMVYDIETIDDVTADSDDYYRIVNPDETDAAGRTLLMRAAKNGNEFLFSGHQKQQIATGSM